MNIRYRRKKWFRRGIVVIAVCMVLLLLAANLLVNIALIPSWMEKTEAFESITEESVAALVHTDDITQNHEASVKETTQWLQEVSGESLTETTEDGYQLVGSLFPQEGSHKWALLLHGYTGWKEEMYPIACKYWKQGYQVVVPDMRAQGESEGDFIGMGETDSRDNLLWLQEILERDPEAEIVLHGQSMGASCALIMAGMEDLPQEVVAVVSDCAYTDAYTMFRRQLKAWFHLPAFPLLQTADWMLQLRAGYSLKDASALEGVKHSKIPLLFIHGDNDQMIPVDMAYELYDASPGEKELLIVEGAGHAQSPDKDPEGYYQMVFTFLEGIR